MIDLSLAAGIFWVSFGIMAYTWFGYPVVLAMLERVFYRPVRRKEETPPVTILLTVYNEEQTIAAKLDNLLTLDYPAEQRRIVVASDGSTDRTCAIVSGYADRGVTLHAHSARRGKAAVLNDEVPQCETEFVVLCDARQRVAADALRRIMADFADPDVGAVSGELVLEDAPGSGIGRGMDAYWRYEKFLRTRESNIHSSVGATGAFLALRRYLWRGLPVNTILDDMVFPFQAVQQGYRVILESGAQVFDRPNETWEREFVRKTRTLAGNFQALFHPVAMAVPAFSGFGFLYLSHKVLRLFGPLLMLLMFWGNYWALRLSTGVSGQEFYATTMIGQGVFYALCLMGFIAERLRLAVPLVHIPYSFLVTQIAIVCGFLRFGSGRDTGTWDKASQVHEDGQMQYRLMRLLFDSTLYCLGVVAAFRFMATPDWLFRLFADLNPQFARGGINLSIPLVILVPLTILYFFRVNEASTRLTAEGFLNIIKGVFHCSVVMVVLIYMMRGQVTVPSESGITSLLPTKVLALSFVINILLLSGWRMVAGWILFLRVPARDKTADVLLVERAPGITSELHSGAGALDLAGLHGRMLSPETMEATAAAPLEDLAAGLDSGTAAEICVSCGMLSRDETLRVLNAIEREGWKASFLPTELEMLLGTTSLSLICYIPVLDVERSPLREFDRVCKRTIDLAVGAALLCAGLPGVIAARCSGIQGAFVGIRKIGCGGEPFVLRRPGPATRGRWWRGMARRFCLGWALVRGDMAAVGAPALTETAWARLTPFEKSLQRFRPGLTGPRRIHLRGMGHVRPLMVPALMYAKLASLQLDFQYLPALLRRYPGRVNAK